MTIENYLEAHVNAYIAKVDSYDISDITPESIEAILTSAAIVYNLVDDLDLNITDNLPTMGYVFSKGRGILEITNCESSIAEYMAPINLAYDVLMGIHANQLDILSRVEIAVYSKGISIQTRLPEQSEDIVKSASQDIFDSIASKMIKVLVDASLELITFCNTCEFVLDKVEEYSESVTMKPNLSLVH